MGTEVKTSEGLGVMCPGCWKVEYARDDGVSTTVDDVLLLRGWQREVVAETEEGEEVFEWLCGLCSRMGPPPRDVVYGRFLEGPE